MAKDWLEDQMCGNLDTVEIVRRARRRKANELVFGKIVPVIMVLGLVYVFLG